MSAMVIVVAVLAGLVSSGRWLRVSQREHYLPWSSIVTAKRWLTSRPPNAVVVVGWAALSLATAVAVPTAAEILGIAAALTAAAWPIGMPVLGTPKLRLTRRASVLGLVSIVLTIAISVVAGVFASGATACAVAPAVAGLATDLGAWITGPFERWNARRFRRTADDKLRQARPRVIAITGSYGKTTVKNHVRDLVGTTFDTVATPASWNNLAGLSRAINEHVTPGTEVFVAEMGTYGPGEIREMARWLRPEVSVITALGPVHLERMKTLETILEAKAEILEGASVAVVSADHEMLRGLGETLREAGDHRDVWLVGSNPQSGLDVVASARPSCAGGDAELVVQVRGEEIGVIPQGSLHPTNVACAVATALAIGVDRRLVSQGLSRLAPATHRSSAATTDTGAVVIDDTFNSNPQGARAALAALLRDAHEGKRYVVTPGMVELGDEQFEANRSFAEAVAASGAELVAVGWTNRRALLSGHPGAVTVKDRAAARAWLSSRLGAGDGVLWENDLPDHYP